MLQSHSVEEEEAKGVDEPWKNSRYGEASWSRLSLQ